MAEMSPPAAKSPYAGYRFPAEVISYAVWLYFRLTLGREFANRIRRRLPRAGDKWHLDEVAIKIAGVQHWLWRAVDQTGMVLDVLVQRRRDICGRPLLGKGKHQDRRDA